MIYFYNLLFNASCGLRQGRTSHLENEGDDDPPPPLENIWGGGQLWKGTDSSISNGIKNPAAPLNK